MVPKQVESEKTAHSAEYELYIMRHGLAAGRAGGGINDDAKRPLTAEGKKKMQEIAHGLVRLGFEVDWIVSSPLVRAVETAGIVSDSLASKVPMDITEALSPRAPAEALISFLSRHPNRRRVLVVGHEPDLGELAARLVGAGRNANLAFKKGGCCSITFNQFPPKSPGQLVWWLTPRVMRKLA